MSLHGKKICIFEKQFYLSHSHKSYLVNNLEKCNQAKWKFYDDCKIAQNFGKTITYLSSETVKRRMKRKEIGKQLFDDVHVYTLQTHLPKRIDLDIQEALNRRFPNKSFKLLCVDVASSALQNSIIVFIMPSDSLREDYHTIANITGDICWEGHLIEQVEVIFIPMSSEMMVDRFQVRDDLLCGAFKDYKKIIIKHDDLHLNEDTQDQFCATCFLSGEPLHTRVFNISSEWLLDVPAPIQLLLYPFINNDSMITSKSPCEYVKTKIQRLYNVYDTLLNTMNFK